MSNKAVTIGNCVKIIDLDILPDKFKKILLYIIMPTLKAMKKKCARKLRSAKKSVRKLSVRMNKLMRKKTKGKKKRGRKGTRRKRGRKGTRGGNSGGPGGIPQRKCRDEDGLPTACDGV